MGMARMETTLKYEADVLTCPACGSQLKAQIVATVKPESMVSEDTTTEAMFKIDAELSSWSIHHTCRGRVRAATSEDMGQ